jgi:hypothetical protein
MYELMPSSYAKEVQAMYSMISMWGRSERQMRMYNIERQRQMVSDMDRLANLVISLREQMSHSAAPETVDVGKQAAEIEKMAHKVGQGMKK